jgi:hypothetical protein
MLLANGWTAIPSTSDLQRLSGPIGETLTFRDSTSSDYGIAADIRYGGLLDGPKQGKINFSPRPSTSALVRNE